MLYSLPVVLLYFSLQYKAGDSTCNMFRINARIAPELMGQILGPPPTKYSPKPLDLESKVKDFHFFSHLLGVSRPIIPYLFARGLENDD